MHHLPTHGTIYCMHVYLLYITCFLMLKTHDINTARTFSSAKYNITFTIYTLASINK
nr:MAG TPA: hypothetical protein [Caudoviricetes sp.]